MVDAAVGAWDHIKGLIVGQAAFGNTLSRCINGELFDQTERGNHCVGDPMGALDWKRELPTMCNFVFQHRHQDPLVMDSGLVVTSLEHGV